MAKKNKYKPSLSSQGFSHTVRTARESRSNRQPSEFETGNHALYAGKLKENVIGWRALFAQVLGNAEESIYDEPFYRGSLVYLFSQLRPDQTARLVICPGLSEIFNGPEDIKKALSPDDQIKWIYRLAKQEFSVATRELEVLNVEEIPEHQALFSALRDSIDPEAGQPDLEKAYGNKEQNLTEETGESDSANEADGRKKSLPIARDLYAAAHSEAEEGDANQLMQMLLETVPRHLRLLDKNPDLHPYYGLTEVAIRLTDILNGCFIHGGVGRQEKYDAIITNLILGKRGRFKDIKSLEPLFELLEGQRFETFHMNPDENIYKKEKNEQIGRLRKVMRLVLGGTLLGIGMLGHYTCERAVERYTQKQEDTYLKHQLEPVDFADPMKNKVHDTADKLSIFKRLTQDMLKAMGDRYGIFPHKIRAIEKVFISYLLQQPQLGFLPLDKDQQIDVVDRFVHLQAFFFKRYHPKRFPYHHLLHASSTRKSWAAWAAKKSHFKHRSIDSMRYFRPIMRNLDHSPSSFIGQYGTYHSRDGYLYRIIIGPRDNRLMAHRHPNPRFPTIDHLPTVTYSEETGTEMAQKFMADVRRFDALFQLERFRGVIRNMIQRSDQEHRRCLSRDQWYSSFMSFKYIDRNHHTSFVDGLGKFAFQIGMGDKTHRRLEPAVGRIAAEGCLVARKFLERGRERHGNEASRFSYRRGLQVASHYARVMDWKRQLNLKKLLERLKNKSKKD